MKKKYYRICYPQEFIYGVGFFEDKENRDFDVPDDGVITNWKPITLKLKDGPFSDYQANSAACRLCSMKLKSIIEEHKSPEDEIQWLPAVVKNEKDEKREYFVLHFPNESDVIDWGKSITIDKHFVVKPVFSLSKIGSRKVFNYPSGGAIVLLVSEDIKEEIEKANCTNLSINKVPLVD